jgi:flagellar FliL protein
MSDANEANDDVEVTPAPPARSGVGLVPLVLIVLCTVLIVLGAVGGGIYWLAKSGRVPIPGVAVSPPPAVRKAEPPKTRMMLLEPLLVNLADPSGTGYLRVVVALQVEDLMPAVDTKPKDEKPPEKGKAVVNEDEVKMRDAALAVIGRETSDSLLAPDGKDNLKRELMQAIQAKCQKLKLDEVMFTEFLVQR